MNVETIRAALVELIAQCEPKSEDDCRGAWYVNDDDHYRQLRFAVKVEHDDDDTRHALAIEPTLEAALNSAAKVLHLIGWAPGMSAVEAVERLRTTMRRCIFRGEPCRMTVEETVCSMGWRENKGLEFSIDEPAPGFIVDWPHGSAERQAAVEETWIAWEAANPARGGAE